MGPALLAVSRIWVQLVNAIVLFAVTIALDPERFGAFMIAASAHAALAVIVGQGVYEYVIKERGNPAAGATGFVFNAVTATSAALLAIALSFLLTDILHNATIGAVLRLLAPIFFLTAIAIFMESVLVREGRLTRVASSMIAADTAGLIAALLGLWMGAGVFALVLQRATRETILAAAYALSRKWSFQWGFDGAEASRLFRFSRAIVSTRIVGAGANTAIDITIGALLSVADAGIFRLANRIIVIGWDILYQPLRTSLWAHLPPEKDNPPAFARILLSHAETFGLGVFALIAGVALIAHDALPLALGPEWSGTAPIIAILAVARLMVTFGAPMEAVFGVQNRTGALVAVTTLTAALNLAAIALAAQFGLYWTAVASGVAIVAAQTPFIVMMARGAGAPAREMVAMTARLGMNAAAMAAVVLPILIWAPGLGLPAWAAIGAATVAGACVFIAAAALFTPRGFSIYASAVAAALRRLGIARG